MSSEDDTRRLLKYRSVLENRINTLELEKSSLRNAIAVLDTQIVRQGFRKPTLPNRETLIKKKGFLDDQISIKSKDGHILGTINIENNIIEFTPERSLMFSTDIPPFQSFLIDRVLSNMKKVDEKQASTGEKILTEILSYDIEKLDSKILKIIIKNYGDDRRLREIRSSIRWVFDKMYDKINQG